MNKVYLVLYDWAYHGEDYGSDASVHTTYDGAKEQFEKTKENIKNEYADYFDDNGEPCEDIVQIYEDDEYSIYPNGRWSEDHNSVKLKEIILQR